MTFSSTEFWTSMRRNPEPSMELLDSYDPRNFLRAPDALLAVTENPHHRAILKNYRRHGLLEVCGRWREILVPEMTVAEPIYRFCLKGEVMVMDGMEAVSHFYQSIAESGMTAIGSFVENMAVADWGLTVETFCCQQVYGRTLVDQGEQADPDKWYAVTSWMTDVWPYDENARLIGEIIYEDIASRRLTPIDPAKVVNTEMATRLMAPYLESEPA